MQLRGMFIVGLILGLSIPSTSYAQTSPLGKDLIAATIRDKRGTQVTLYIPESLNNAQSARRLYGTPVGVLGFFETLYDSDRRAESYESAIRELSMQPLLQKSFLSDLRQAMDQVGIATEDIEMMLDVVQHGAEAINKKYVSGGTITADVRNKIATIGRKLNAAQKYPIFAQACVFLADVQATAKLTDIIAGAFLFNALSTDHAENRLKEIERLVDVRKKRSGRVDPALETALTHAKINIFAARNGLGAFAVAVNDNLDELVSSTLNLGATLATISLNVSASVALWIGAPLMTYNTLRGISDQWEMAQDAVTMATLTMLIGETSSRDNNSPPNKQVLYGQYAFYTLLERALSTGGAKFKDFLSPGHVNRDWADYYAQRKQLILSSLLETSADAHEPTDDLSLALILDSSGSMQDNDPSRLRVEAAHMALDKLSDQAEAALVDFDGTATVLHDLVRVGGRRAALKEASRKIDASGSTSIGAALESGAQVLEHASTKTAAAVLLTDGRGDYRDEVQAFVENGWRLYTIGLGKDVNVSLLSELAKQTGGLYLKATTARDLGQFFDLILGDLEGASVMAAYEGRLKAGQQRVASFEVEDQVENLYVSLFWPGSMMQVTLQAPDGQRQYPQTANGDTYYLLRLDRPQPGTWIAVVDALQTQPGGESFQLQISGRSPVRPVIRAFPATLFPGVSGTVEIVIARDGVDPESIKAKAYHMLESGQSQSLALRTMSLSNEIVIIGEIPPDSKPGDRRVRIEIAGRTAGGHPFQRHVERAYTITNVFDDLDSLPIVRVSGTFLEIQGVLGQGLFVGLRVRILDATGETIAQGDIVNISRSTITIQLTTMTRTPKLSDRVAIDRFQWQRDGY